LRIKRKSYLPLILYILCFFIAAGIVCGVIFFNTYDQIRTLNKITLYEFTITQSFFNSFLKSFKYHIIIFLLTFLNISFSFVAVFNMLFSFLYGYFCGYLNKINQPYLPVSVYFIIRIIPFFVLSILSLYMIIKRFSKKSNLNTKQYQEKIKAEYIIMLVLSILFSIIIAFIETKLLI